MIIQINNIHFWTYHNCGCHYIKKFIEENQELLNTRTEVTHILIIRNPVLRLLDYYHQHFKYGLTKKEFINEPLSITNQFNLLEGKERMVFPISYKFLTSNFTQFITILFHLVHKYKYKLEPNLKSLKYMFLLCRSNK